MYCVFSQNIIRVPVKNAQMNLGWCSSVNWARSCEGEGCQFDFWLGHMPKLWATSSVGGGWEATTHWCFSPLSPSLTLSLKLNKWNLKKNAQMTRPQSSVSEPEWWEAGFRSWPFTSITKDWHPQCSTVSPPTNLCVLYLVISLSFALNKTMPIFLVYCFDTGLCTQAAYY